MAKANSWANPSADRVSGGAVGSGAAVGGTVGRSVGAGLGDGVATGVGEGLEVGAELGLGLARATGVLGPRWRAMKAPTTMLAKNSTTKPIPK